MKLRLHYAALSDVGRVRKDNQDAGYAGPHLLAIADGVGGAARGDIASHAAIEQLRRLDTPPGNTMLEELAGTIHRTHDKLADLVEANPEIDGTSTTVTAAVFDGTQLALGHVGDSRAYLLRNGELSQLTADHTFVQSLVDEGRITADEARIHPHRNLILRAVDGVHEPEPDVAMIAVEEGDRLLFCSDGCSGALNDEDLARILGEGPPELASVQLVHGALDAGSSDNVTVVVADVVAEDSAAVEGAATGPLLVGAAAGTPRAGGRADTAVRPAANAHDTGELEPVDEEDPEAIRYAPRPPRRLGWPRRIAALAVVVVLVWLIGSAAYAWTQTQYYVGNAGQQVVIYRGVEADVPGLRMHHVYESSNLTMADLTTFNQGQVRDGIGADSLGAARTIISRLKANAPCAQASATPTPSPTPTATRTPTRRTTTRAKTHHHHAATAKPSARTSARASAKATPRPTVTPSPTSSPSPTTNPCP